MIRNIADLGFTEEYMISTYMHMYYQYIKASVLLNYWYLGQNELSNCRNQINQPIIDMR